MHLHYATGEPPAPGDRVRHYVDGDVGDVTEITREANVRIVTVEWDRDGAIEHYPDELRLLKPRAF